jgi:hypothetical protein
MAHSMRLGHVQGLVGVRVQVVQPVDRQRFEYRLGDLRHATGRVSGRGAANGVLFLDEPRAALSTEVLGEVGCDTIRVQWDGPVAVVTLDRPERMDALRWRMHSELAHAHRRGVGRPPGPGSQRQTAPR